MRKARILLALILGLSILAGAEIVTGKPVKWSAPMHEYPNPWKSTMPPPPPMNWNSYPYPGYGTYGYGGYGQGRYYPGAAYYGNSPAYPQDYRQGVYPEGTVTPGDYYR